METGHDESCALAEAAERDLYEIKAAIPYTEADLNWMDKNSRSSLEMNQPGFRPEIAETVQNMEQYDTVFIGFPIWWYVAPTIINTFLETYDFSGKTIVLFATSGGSGFGRTVEKLKASVAPNVKILEGKILSKRISTKELAQWVHDTYVMVYMMRIL